MIEFLLCWTGVGAIAMFVLCDLVGVETTLGSFRPLQLVFSVLQILIAWPYHLWIVYRDWEYWKPEEW